jgi:hypothetical protein
MSAVGHQRPFAALKTPAFERPLSIFLVEIGKIPNGCC